MPAAPRPMGPRRGKLHSAELSEFLACGQIPITTRADRIAGKSLFCRVVPLPPIYFLEFSQQASGAMECQNGRRRCAIRILMIRQMVGIDQDALAS
jgi:hypothetical protein